MTDQPVGGLEVTWWARLRYQGSWPVLVAVGWLTLLVVFASTAILVVTNSTFTTEHSRTLVARFWQSLLRVVDPGTMASDVGWGPRLLSLMVTVSGIVLFGTLIGTISATMQTRLATLRRGRAVVLESGHLVILGWSPWIDVLIYDLALAGDQRRPSSIVVLADEDKATMDDALRAAIGGRRGPRLICRHGDPTLASELARVNIREAETVVAVGSEAPTSDATVASTVLAVGVACGGFSNRTVVAEVDDPAAAETLARACAGEVEVVGAIEHASPIGIRRVDDSFVFVPPQRLAVTVLRVPEPEREVVSVLADRPCSAIAVLAHQGLAPTDADAVTLATLMAVRQASAVNAGDDPHVVAELTDDKHAELAVADQTYQHGLLAIGTSSHGDSSFALRLHSERTEMLRLEPDDDVAALV